MVKYAAVFCACFLSAHAELVCLPSVAPGGVVPNTNDNCPGDRNGSAPLGTIVADTGVELFNFNGSGQNTSGQFEEVVFRETSGTLDFLMQLNVTNGNIFTVDTGNFHGFDTELGSLSEVSILGFGSTAPTFDFRSSDGATVGFGFAGNPLAGLSFTLGISTDAINFAGSNVGLIGSSGGTQTLFAFEPVPEPPFYGLLAFGVGAFLWKMNKRGTYEPR
jgi:hypothetical protein